MSRLPSVVLGLLLVAASVAPVTAAPTTAAPVTAAPTTAAPVTAASAASASTQPEASQPAAKSKQPAREPQRYASDHVIVKWKDDAKAKASEKARGLARVAELSGKSHAVKIKAKGESVEQLVARLKNDPAVAWAEPDYLGTVEGGEVSGVSVNDPLTWRQYSLDQMQVRDAWSLSRGGSRLIAVIDTGVQYEHPDLAGQIAMNAAEQNGTAGVDDDGNGYVDDVYGWDFVNDDNDPRDDNNHGTWVSGVLAANQDNGAGIAGVTWSDQLLEVKVMAFNGYGLTSDLADGIDYAVARGAKIINMSVGGFPDSTPLRDAVARAWAAGAVLVAAAGNNRREEISYPASFPNVISVSATQADDEFANWSSYGPYVDVAAPGTAVTMTDCGGCSPYSHGTPTYRDISGTSFATPNTAGVVALIWGRYPGYSNADVVNRLLDTTDDLGFPGWDNRYGHGRVNAYRAVGGNPPAVTPQVGDAVEPNQTAGAARTIALGTIRPNIYPAGDTDYFAYNLPRAGRFDVSVTPVEDTSRSTKSQLSVDPILELWVDGSLVKTVDTQSSSWVTERASYQAPGPMRIVVGIRNWLPNGSRTAYTLASALVDNVAPVITARAPSADSAGVSLQPTATVTFDESVTGVSTSSFALYNAAGTLIPSSVGYDASSRQARLSASTALDPLSSYSLAIGSGITDANGNRLVYSRWSFTTGVEVVRIDGPDRYSVSASLSASAYQPGVAVAYLASGQVFPDALAGAPLARRGGGPLLLVRSGDIPAPIAAELIRLRPGRIVILGGPGSVGDAVARAAAAYTDGTVSRLWGADRYAAAAAMSAATFSPGSPLAYVATGQNFPDALAGAAVAARDGAPVLLVRGDAIPAATAAELSRLKPGRIVLLGGPGSVSEAVAGRLAAYTTGSVTRLAGADRYAAAAAISAASYPADGPATVYVATGTVFSDSLSASALAGRDGGPLLLVRPDGLPAEVAAELRRLNPARVIIVGGPASVSDGVRAAIAALWD